MPKRSCNALVCSDLDAARRRLSYIVGRDTQTLDESEISRATIESVAESLVDGIVAPLFWAVIGGAPGALIYRTANTLDSMVGHRTPAYEKFGKLSARIDDLLNWVPARMCALMICLFRIPGSWRKVGREAAAHASPNAGWPEAAMAYALGVRLGGTNYYDGEPVQGPIFNGSGRAAGVSDIKMQFDSDLVGGVRRGGHLFGGSFRPVLPNSGDRGGQGHRRGTKQNDGVRLTMKLIKRNPRFRRHGVVLRDRIEREPIVGEGSHPRDQSLPKPSTFCNRGRKYILGSRHVLAARGDARPPQSASGNQHSSTPILRAAGIEDSLSDEAQALCCRPLKSASQARHAPQPGRWRSRKGDDENENEAPIRGATNTHEQRPSTA